MPTNRVQPVSVKTAIGLTLAAMLLGSCANTPTSEAGSTTTSGAQSTATAVAQSITSRNENCVNNPFDKRSLYLRGSFNTWSADENLRFTYRCNRFELVTKLNGAQQFKVADDNWASDADFGLPPNSTTDKSARSAEGNSSNAPAPTGSSGIGLSGIGLSSIALAARGSGIPFTFYGVHRLIFTMPDQATEPSQTPRLTIESCPPPPLGETQLFLRGTMNNWTALDDYAFQYSCDAYYLNIKLNTKQEFKIADAAWANPTTFGGAGSGSEVVNGQPLSIGKASDTNGVSNLQFAFDGEHTVRLAFAEGKPTITIGAKTFADPAAKSVTDPVALSVQHDSRNLADKAPFGAMPAGTRVQFGLSALKGVDGVTLVIEKRRLEGNQELLEYREVARVPMIKAVAKPSPSQLDHWQAEYAFNDVSVYGYYLEVVTGGKTYVYQNNRDAIHWTREKGSNGVGQIEEKSGNTKSIRRFRHTVYATDFVVPTWAKDAVYYAIFPERFRNGDKKNDPKPGVNTYQDKDVEFHKNWLDKPYKPNTGDGSDAVYNNDFFGGDIAGIIEKLDYIADLGANAIYTMPMFTASSNHKYDTADFKNIDPMFGTNDDFTRLTVEAAKRGIRVIPDTSLNHVGSDSIYFDRYSKYDKYKTSGAFAGGNINTNSPCAGWFSFDQSQTDPNKQFKGWVGVIDLPELNKASPAFRKFAYEDKDSVMKLWLDRGASGWRMDVAPWVPDDFWKPWRAAIKQHKPDAITIAETWFDASKFFLGDAFDSTMNYIFRNTVLDFAAGGNAKMQYQNLEFIREVYPPQALYALMNLLSSHDVARSLHVLGFIDGNMDENKIQDAKNRLRLATFFQMVYPGAPAIFYGDEVGVTGGEDPYNRATYPWADLGGKPDTALLADFKRLIKMRKDHAVLRHGSITAPLLADEHVIVLARQLVEGGNEKSKATWAITAMNNATTEKTVTIQLPNRAAQRYVDALTGEAVNAANGNLTLRIPALFGTVLVSR